MDDEMLETLPKQHAPGFTLKFPLFLVSSQNSGVRQLLLLCGQSLSPSSGGL